MEKDLDTAIEKYRKLVKKYEKHSLADDAQYRIGEIYYHNKKSPTQAYVEFLKGDITFPKETCVRRPRGGSMNSH